MEFIPLAIWCVGLLAINSYDVRTFEQFDVSVERREKSYAFNAWMLVVGAMLFTILGLLCL